MCDFFAIILQVQHFEQLQLGMINAPCTVRRTGMPWLIHQWHTDW